MNFCLKYQEVLDFYGCLFVAPMCLNAVVSMGIVKNE